MHKKTIGSAAAIKKRFTNNNQKLTALTTEPNLNSQTNFLPYSYSYQLANQLKKLNENFNRYHCSARFVNFCIDLTSIYISSAQPQYD